MKYRSFFALLLLGSATLSSCNKMLDGPSHRVVTGQNMWQQKNDALAAVSACYAMMRAALVNENAYWVYGELRAGDFQATARGDLKAVVSNNLTANYPTMDEWRDWRRFYAAIGQCNTTILHLPDVVKNDYRYSAEDMKLDMAQVKYIRAFLYYYIVRVWGDVPLVLQPTDGNFTDVARTGWHQVLDTAAQNVKDVLDDLPWLYDGTAPDQQGNYRGENWGHHYAIAITKGMGLTLLAHIYDWEKDYTDALYYADAVINNQSRTRYGLVNVNDLTRLDGTFRGRGYGSIFQVDFNFDHAEISPTGQLEDWTLRAPDIPKTQSEIYVPKDSILSIYNDPNDTRPKYFFNHLDDADPEFYKIKQVNQSVQNPTLRFYSSAIVVFRYEELYLMRAEIKARLGMNDAISDLNIVRTERGLNPIDPSVTGNDLLDQILDERRRELIGEGWRWFDLVHYGKIPAYTRLTDADVANGAAWWPLSKDALSQNKALTQNSFWQ